MFPTMTSIRFENANVWIGDGTTANSITVEDGVIGIEGARVDETVDCCDGFLMPAFADGHAHPVFGGLEQQFAPIRHSTSVDEVVTAVRSWAAANPDAQPEVRVLGRASPHFADIAFGQKLLAANLSVFQQQ